MFDVLRSTFNHDDVVKIAFQDELARQLEGQDDSEGLVSPFEMGQEVPAGTTNKNQPELERLTVPYDGIIRQIRVHSPDSTFGLGMRLKLSNGQYILPHNPDAGYVPVAEISEPFDLRGGVQIEEGQIIEAEYVNFDTENPHFVSVLPEVERI